jgi:hypothetical protein
MTADAYPTDSYPLRVTASLERPPGRWLWLVKWLLVIPHALVLLVLWACFFVLTVIAFFAILFTGRYPRALFEFNAGVLRWTWRVSFYSYSALGTDAYPPFSLHDDPSYPAHLDVVYPETLSRGLVLVKWWLLAIPHYLVLSIFFGAGPTIVWEASGSVNRVQWAISLVTLLALIAGVVLLVSGPYPRGIFDLLVGLNRWGLRVTAYAALMTDQYPPFRLDQGGAEPGAPRSPTPAPTPVAVAQGTGPAPSGQGTGAWGPGRVISLALGGLALLIGLGTLGAGGTLLAVDRGWRDADGFLMTRTAAYRTSTFALVTEPAHIETDAAPWVTDRVLGDVKITVTALGGAPVFVGVGQSADVDRYLAGVGHATIASGTTMNRVGRLTTVTPGGPPSAAPDGAMSWAHSASGTGTQTLTFRVEPGTWSLLVMNADGSGGVAADVALGAKFPGVTGFAGVTIAVGAALLLLGLALVLGAVLRTGGRPTQPVGPVGPVGTGPSGPPQPTYPAGPPQQTYPAGPPPATQPVPPTDPTEPEDPRP